MDHQGPKIVQRALSSIIAHRWLIVAIYAVRRVTRPLAALAEAAGALGRDIDTSPLPESGSDEVARASRAFNEMQRRLKRFIDDRSRILTAVSHDLKTPLTRLRNRAEAVLGKPQDESVIQDIIADADGLINTFNALLMISQVETGARSVQFEEHQLVPILQDVHELFEPSAEETEKMLHL